MAKSMLIPDAWAERETMPRAHRDLYSYCNSVMEPWDGPAAICAFGGNWVLAGMDRNGLRPLRYTITDDGLLVAGSETGMVRLPEQNVVAKGRLGPGQMIAVDLGAGRLFKHREIMDQLSAGAAFSDWVKNITVIDTLMRAKPGQPASFEKEELRRRQLAAGFSHGGPGADPPADGRGGEGSHRLDGRRRAARGAVRTVSRPAPLSSARISARSPTRRSTPCANAG